MMTPNLSLQNEATRPSCIASDEPGVAPSHLLLAPGFPPSFSCLSNETTGPSPSLPLRDPARGQDALSITGRKTH